MEIILLELKKVLRNRRFFIFTIIIPIIFNIVLCKSSSQSTNQSIESAQMLFYVCLLYGMLGNNLVTLGTRIAKEKEYYLELFKITNFNILKNTMVQVTVQAILNIIILLILVIVNGIFLNLTVNTVLVESIMIIYIFSTALSFVGILVGVYFDTLSLQVIATPLYMVVMILSLPTNFTSYLPGILQKVQRFTPGPYMWEVIDGFTQDRHIVKALAILKFGGGLIFIVILSSLFLLQKQRKEIER